MNYNYSEWVKSTYTNNDVIKKSLASRLIAKMSPEEIDSIFRFVVLEHSKDLSLLECSCNFKKYKVMKPIPFKENDTIHLPDDDNEYIIQKIGEFGICTIVSGTIKKKMHWSEFETSDTLLKNFIPQY